MNEVQRRMWHEVQRRRPAEVQTLQGQALVGRRLHPQVCGVEEWAGRREVLQRRLAKEMKAGRVAGAYYLNDARDEGVHGVVRMQVQKLPPRPRNWLKIGILTGIGIAGLGVLVGVTYWVAKLMAAVALGASVGGVWVLIIIGALLLAAGGGTVTVTTVTTIRRRWF